MSAPLNNLSSFDVIRRGIRSARSRHSSPLLSALGVGSLGMILCALAAAGGPASPAPRPGDWSGSGAGAAFADFASDSAADSAAGRSRKLVVPGQRPTASDLSDVVVAIDPAIGADDDAEFAALRAEASGKGRRLLRNGDVLSGRIVTEGLDFEAGATIFLSGDTEIIAMGDSVLDARFMPLPSAYGEDIEAIDRVAEAQPDAEAELEGAVVTLAQAAPIGPIAPSCPAVSAATGKRGKRPPKVSIVFGGNWTFNGLIAGQCSGPLAIQAPIPLTTLVVGARSAKATGGAGGPGLNVTLRGVGNSTLTIAGDICNGQGEDGASAVALGVDGPPCECGGDAYAVGGRGGDAGTLTVTARNIVWDMLNAAITVQPGGAGGAASALAGDGGDCDLCGGAGGRGGHAAAIGGKPGKNGRIYIAASNSMTPAPQTVLGSGIFSIVTSPAGGGADSDSGSGGRGGDCFTCASDGGPGGKAGHAYARGADGAPGTLLAASVGGAVKAYFGSDAGNGGNADSTAGSGGDGGIGGSCLCSVPLQAGDGGDGNQGGSATARGGDGGDAKGGKPALALVNPFAGNGGNAFADCGVGGFGGNGGWCLLDTPEFCTPGSGGAKGKGGSGFAVGGRGGKADAAAIPGINGFPVPSITTTCADGLDGLDGNTDCPRVGDDCCVPGTVPGCGDLACALLVCTNDPFCCDVLWDAICAQQAIQLCPICHGGGTGGDCCVPHEGPGCNAPDCTGIVCSMNPFCCELQWDSNCAAIAQMLCGVCAGS